MQSDSYKQRCTFFWRLSVYLELQRMSLPYFQSIVSSISSIITYFCFQVFLCQYLLLSALQPFALNWYMSAVPIFLINIKLWFCNLNGISSTNHVKCKLYINSTCTECFLHLHVLIAIYIYMYLQVSLDHLISYLHFILIIIFAFLPIAPM